MGLGMRPRVPPAPSPSEKHLRTPQRVTFFKRRRTLFNRVSLLCGLTGARAAVIVLSSTGKLYFCGGSSVEEMGEICFDDVRCDGGAMLPMGPKEGVEWVKKQRQRPEITKITDQVQLRRTFSNRLLTLIKSASELCTVTDARAAVVVFSHTKSASELCTVTDARAPVVVFSHTGFHHLFDNSSFEDLISDWVEKQRDSCKTEEAFGSLSLKHEAVLCYVREKLKDVSGSGNSGVGAGCDSEVLSDDHIDSVLQNFKDSQPVLFSYFKDYVRDGLLASPVNSAVASDGLLTSPVNSAVASGSSGKEPMRSVVVGCEFNPHSSLNLSENNPSVNAGAGGLSGVGDGHSYVVLNDDDANWIRSLLANNGNCSCNGDSDSFLTSPVNLAAGGGSLGVESASTLSDLEGREFVDSLLDLSGGLDENDCLIPPENSTGHG